MNQILAVLLVLSPAQLADLQAEATRQFPIRNPKILMDTLAEMQWDLAIPTTIRFAITPHIEILKRLQALGVITYGELQGEINNE